MPFSHGGMASDDDMRADKTMRSIFGIMVESSNPDVVYIIACFQLQMLDLTPQKSSWGLCSVKWVLYLTSSKSHDVCTP